MLRNIFAVGQMTSLLFGVGKAYLQSKINREGIGCVDITGENRKESYNIPVRVRIF